jgi:secondary thiamine-phosphate synthase enzyme
MRQAVHEINVDTPGPGVSNLTGEVSGWVRSSGIVRGLLTLHVMHTSASLLIMENASPEVMADLERFFMRVAPWGDPLWAHDDEGPDDMPAHIRTAITHTNLSLPVIDGLPTLGTWQGIYLYEHRERPHRRRVALHLLGE